MKKRMILFAFVLVLYIVPVNLSAYYASLPILEGQNYAIADDSTPWLTGFGYRKTINITQALQVAGPVTNGTYYAVKFNIEFGSGSDTGQTIYLSSHSQPDFDDVRFTDNDGITELDFWIRNYTTSENATFWVEVIDDLVVPFAAIDQVIYIYYGNSEVTTTSDGDATFLYFDDFEDNDLTEWDVLNMEIKTDRVLNGNYAAGVTTVADNGYVILDTATITTPIAYHISINAQLSLRGASLIPFTQQNQTQYAGYVKSSYEAGISPLYYYDGSWQSWAGSADDIYEDIWYDFEVRVDFSYTDPDMRAYHGVGNDFSLAYDGTEDWHTALDTDPIDKQIELFKILIQGTYECWIDDFFIRHSTSVSEPSVSSTGSEQEYLIWNDCGEVDIIFEVDHYTRHVDVLLVIFGLILIPSSVMYMVIGGKEKASSDKFFYACILFIMGVALLLGGIS